MKAGRPGDQGPGAGPHRPAPLRGRGEAGPGRGERREGGRASRPGGGGPRPSSSSTGWRAWSKKGDGLQRRGGQGQGGLRRRAGPAGRGRSSGTPGAGAAYENAQTNLSQDHPRLAHRRHGDRAHPRGRRAGARLRLLRGRGDDHRRARQHGGEDRGRRARGGAPQARPAGRGVGRRARGPDLRGHGGGDRPEGAPSRTPAPRPR